MNRLSAGIEKGLAITKEVAPVIADKVRTGAIILSAYLLHFNLYPIAAKVAPIIDKTASIEPIRQVMERLPLNPIQTHQFLLNSGMSPETAGLITVASIILPVVPLSLLVWSKVGFGFSSSPAKISENL